MAKDRPINNIRVLEGERPFKLYNPEIPAGNLMFVESRLEQQQMALNMSGYTHQQRPRHTTQQPQQQQLQQYSSQPLQQFGYPDDYRVMNQQASLMANEVSLQSFIYDDLGLDPVNQVSSEPMNLHQAVSNNMMPVTSGKAIAGNMAPQSGSCMSNFMAPSRNQMRSMNGSDPLSSFYDPPPLSPFTGNVYPTSAHQSNAMDSTPMIRSQYPMGNSTPFAQNPINATNNKIETLHKETSGTSSYNLFKVKQERDVHCSTSADSLSPSSINSPSSSDAGASDTPRGFLKRSNSGGCSSPPSATSTSLGARDPAYLEKRKKNNESAKRCREARRKKEGMLAMRIVSLEEENLQLRTEVCLLERELEDLRARLFT